MALLLCTSVSRGEAPSPTILLCLPLVVLASKLHGLYDRDELVMRKTTIDEAPALFQLATLWTLVVWLLGDVLVRGSVSSGQALGLWLSLWSFALVFRVAARRFAARHVPTERLLGIGIAETYERLAGKLELARVDAQLVASVPVEAVSSLQGTTRHPCEQSLLELVRELDIHRVLVVPSPDEPQLALELVRAVKSIGMRVSIVPDVLDVVGNAVVFDEIAGMTMLGVRRFELSRASLIVKRGFDLAGALVGLAVMSPLMLVLAVAIKLDSAGPVLFWQERVGRGGQRFRICKFRTMVVDAEARKAELLAHNEAAAGLFKIRDDPRVTRVGRVLRRTCLDELPQLLNVVRGEMSLVGPRPLILSEDRAISGYDRRRLHLTPGMTGLWQIMGSSRVPLQEMVKIDYLYITTWTLFQDVKILVRTALYVLSRPGM
ncbi:MAG TPA: exopolysaccharide biosynthesis polyprenyl glycosylphosphotransferase [Baekduia sp.]|nr:exopolysaccharide biosynthesis polyprenyl glycosylphosphotransferase [Baekduia sp.]